ncbi:HNH endonuclease [Mesorhizobium sp.]|uniref:NACHT domain-containing protein n=1 Tax=Mesorhizobium sp. TaxID=1871066 RepID=UPI000FE62B56|nr:HNH endonuclease [Mesorhizobium sp.]RWE79585.1 MAG: hypothetical protein EOS42_01035 [Mesorhizobium sp.]
MAKGSRKYSEQTIKVLYGLASHCAYPGCTQPLILPARGIADEVVLAQVCHIIAASDNGPRGDPNTSLEARNEPDNLLLMCPTHHTVVDKQHAAYPAPLLREWKAVQQRETITGLAPYRAAITRHLRGELSNGALFRRRTDAPPAEPRLESMERDATIAHDLAETLELLDRPLIAIIGGSGSGKTTLLNQVALAASEAPVAAVTGIRSGALPLIVNCARFDGSLPALIASEALNATGIAIDLDGMQGVDFPLNLYCDDFQYCPNKRAMLEQLRALTHQHRGARCALLTHELPDYGVIERFSVAVFRIADLDDDGLLDLFTGFMDEDAAETLLDDLASRGEIDAIRQPVLATLVAVAHTDTPSGTEDRPTPLRRGELLRRVIRGGILRDWVASRSPDLASPHAGAVADMLAQIAATLVRADKEFLPETALVFPGGAAAVRWIGIGQSCGLLRRKEQELGFAHAAIRDYFAAEWLLRAPPSRLFGIWFSTRWHGALKNFASLWSPDSRRLFWLRLSGRISLWLISVLRIAPQSFATKLFYLMLEFAAESRIDERWLQLGIFNQYRRGHTFLDHASPVSRLPFIGRWDDERAHVYRLFGRLRHAEIDHWLRTTDRRLAIHGIRQDTSEAGLEALLRGINSDDDQLADDIAVELAFEYPKAMLRRVVDRLIADSEVATWVLLRRISHAYSMRKFYAHEPDSRNAARRNRIGTVLATDDYWRDRMLGLLLEDASDAIADGANDVLRCLDPDHLLRADVEATLVESLGTGDELARRRAARFLVYGRAEESLAALIAAVRVGPDISVAARACWSLLYRDTHNAPQYYLTVLRRFGHLDAVLWQARQASIAQTVAAYVAEMNHKPYKKYVRAFLAYLQCGKGRVERIIAADGLDRIRGRVVAEAMRSAFEVEADGVVRDHIAEHWATSRDVGIDEAIPYLLASPIPPFRSLAADLVHRKNDRPSAEVVDLIRQAAELEADAQIRYDLGRALDYIKMVEQNQRLRQTGNGGEDKIKDRRVPAA